MIAVPRVLFVTGTDTDVGKTITTAALAATFTAVGRSVAVYKPTQAGSAPTGEGDVDTVRRLTGIRSLTEGIRLPEPMAPVAAAARAGVELPAARIHVDTIHELAERHDHTLVEGAGGLLVHLDSEGHTLADLAVAMPDDVASTVVVCRSGLGTLNHTDLVLEALARRSIATAGLVIGAWPRTPTDIDIDNRECLRRRAAPLIGAIPEGAGSLSRTRFRDRAALWFPEL